MVCSKPECTMSFSDAPWRRKFTISKSSIQVRWDVKVGPKLGQIGAKWDKCETSKISFQYILPLRAKMSWKLIFKSPRFVPFYLGAIWPNLGATLTSLDIRQLVRVKWPINKGWIKKNKLMNLSKADPPENCHWMSKNCQKIGNFLTFKWQFSGASGPKFDFHWRKWKWATMLLY